VVGMAGQSDTRRLQFTQFFLGVFSRCVAAQARGSQTKIGMSRVVRFR